jgi:hypothetical protein
MQRFDGSIDSALPPRGSTMTGSRPTPALPATEVARRRTYVLPIVREVMRSAGLAVTDRSW